mgnify:CR=1 FL=1
MTYLVVSDYSLQYLGGAQVAMLRQAEALASQGSRVVVIAPGGDATSMPAGVEYMAPPPARAIPGAGLPVFTNNEQLRSWFRKRYAEMQPTAVLTHSEFGLAVAAVQVARETGIVTLHTVHTFFWRSHFVADVTAPIAQWLYRRKTGLKLGHERLSRHPLANKLRHMTLAMCRQVDVVVSPSAHQGARLKECDLARVEVISNVTAVVPHTGVTDAPADRLVLIWAARFAPEKRLSVAVRAMALVRERLTERGHDANVVELQVAGGSAQPDEHVTWLGKIEPHEVRSRIAASNAVVITSVGFDNQPMVALEAFAAGRPVIVSDPVLATEFGEAAIQARDAEAHGLAETILELSSNRDALARASAAAHKRAALSSPEGHVKRLRAVVESVKAERA